MRDTTRYTTTLHGAPYGEDGEQGEPVLLDNAPHYARAVLHPGQDLCVWCPDGDLVTRFACANNGDIVEIAL